MSTHQFPWHPERDPSSVERLCRAYLRPPASILSDGVTFTLTFTPDLTAGEVTMLGRLMRLADLMHITPAEWAAVEADVAGLVTFQNLASPTLVQTVAAVKAQSRILRALLRD